MRAGGVPTALSARGRAGYEAVLERHFSGDASLMHRRLMNARHARKTWCSRSKCFVRRPANV
jgi:hypothetical protein